MFNDDPMIDFDKEDLKSLFGVEDFGYNIIYCKQASGWSWSDELLIFEFNGIYIAVNDIELWSQHGEYCDEISQEEAVNLMVEFEEVCESASLEIVYAPVKREHKTRKFNASH